MINPKDYINETAEKWLQLLETTDKEQGKKGFLCEIEESGCRFCCLGILEDMLETSFEIFKTEEGNEVKKYMHSSHLLSPKTQLKVGLIAEMGGTSNGRVLFGNQPHSSLAGANDAGVSFKIIAATIRKHPDQFFKRIVS